MPTYDYFCDENQQTISVVHGMREKLATWGEVCARASAPLGKTSPGTPVTRVITAGIVVTKGRSTQDNHGAGSCCGPAGCGSP